MHRRTKAATLWEGWESPSASSPSSAAASAAEVVMPKGRCCRWGASTEAAAPVCAAVGGPHESSSPSSSLASESDSAMASAAERPPPRPPAEATAAAAEYLLSRTAKSDLRPSPPRAFADGCCLTDLTPTARCGSSAASASAKASGMVVFPSATSAQLTQRASRKATTSAHLSPAETAAPSE